MINSLGNISTLMSSAFQQRIQTVFENSDSDGDGKLNEAEFETFISNAPAPPEAIADTEPDTAAMFTDTDTDSDGLLSLVEVESAAPQGPPPGAVGARPSFVDLLSGTSEDDESSTNVFSYLDTDGDGVVSIEEILAVFSKNAAEMYSNIQQSSLVSGNDLDVSA